MSLSQSRWSAAFLLSVLGAMVLLLTIAALTPGYLGDIYQYKLWTKWVTEQGVANMYAADDLAILYPPINLYLWAGVGHFWAAWLDPSFDIERAQASQLLTWLIKLPTILFHLMIGVVVFLLVRRRHGERLAWAAGTIVLLDPALVYGVAHWGQPDSEHSLFSLLSVAALSANRWIPAGAAIALAGLAKPQSWILVPFIVAVAWKNGGRVGVVRCGLGGVAALLVGLAPFLLGGTTVQLARLSEYVSARVSSQSISANAHNIWWLPTLARGQFINDLEPVIGSIPFRWLAVGLVGLVLLACLARLTTKGDRPDLYLLTATLCAGWFFFTPRAHENHSFFVLPFLAVAWPARPKLLVLYALASLALLLNLALEDPLIVGPISQAGFTGAARPNWFVLLTLLNVAVFAVLVAGLMKASGLFRLVWTSIADFRKRVQRPDPVVGES